MSLWVSDIDAIELWGNASEDDLQAVIWAAYRQVLGNIHVSYGKPTIDKC
jgi:RNase P/RNase MRP subunit POP5